MKKLLLSTMLFFTFSAQSMMKMDNEDETKKLIPRQTSEKQILTMMQTKKRFDPNAFHNLLIEHKKISPVTRGQNNGFQTILQKAQENIDEASNDLRWDIKRFSKMGVGAGTAAFGLGNAIYQTITFGEVDKSETAPTPLEKLSNIGVSGATCVTGLAMMKNTWENKEAIEKHNTALMMRFLIEATAKQNETTDSEEDLLSLEVKE